MTKAIVTTTIYPPSKATLEFAKKSDWEFIIVGDLSTPHKDYRNLEKRFPNVHYLSPKDQEKKYKKISDTIGWKCIMRRNIGFLTAYDMGADIVATIDDDNIPYDNWGQDILVNKEVEVDYWETELPAFDPLSILKSNQLWHRGYPIELLKERHNIVYMGKIKRKVLVQADLWDGDPDIDALARIVYNPIIRIPDIKNPYCSNKIVPFNSQNTFLSREVLPFYSVLPHIGRMDDIWGAYILQHFFPNSVVFNKASVYQQRNEQDVIKNLEKEMYGYKKTLTLIRNLDDFEKYLPEKTLEYYNTYRSHFTKPQH